MGEDQPLREGTVVADVEETREDSPEHDNGDTNDRPLVKAEPLPPLDLNRTLAAEASGGARELDSSASKYAEKVAQLSITLNAREEVGAHPPACVLACNITSAG